MSILGGWVWCAWGERGGVGYWIVLGPVGIFLCLLATPHLARGSCYAMSVVPPAQLSACAVRSYCTVIRCPQLLALKIGPFHTPCSLHIGPA